MKIKRMIKWIGRVLLLLLALLILFTLVTCIVHRNKTGREMELLKEKG